MAHSYIWYSCVGKRSFPPCANRRSQPQNFCTIGPNCPVQGALGTGKLYKPGLVCLILIGVASSARFVAFIAMFSSFLRASLAALVASAVAVSAAPAIIIDVDLTVMLSLPDSKGDGSENVKVVTTVANTGNKPVQLLEDPRGVLRYFPEDSFIITGPADSHPSFNGARVSLASGYLTNLRSDAFGFCF